MSMSTPEPIEPMANNFKVQNTSPSIVLGVKRRVEDVLNGSLEGEGKENGIVQKKQALDATLGHSLFELRNRKLLFKQALPSRNLPRRRTLNFQGYILDEVEGGRTVKEIPEEHWALIAMAGNEISSANESSFIKQLKAALGLEPAEQESLPNEVLTVVSRKLFTLRHYGFFSSQFPNGVKIPSSLQIRCWEVNEPEKWFPSEQLEALRARRAERESVTEECFKLLQGMTDAQKLELVCGSKDGKDISSKSANMAQKSALPKEIQIEAARLKKQQRDQKKAAWAEKKAVSSSDQTLSDYQKTFRPLPPKRYVKTAKINEWNEIKKGVNDSAADVSGQKVEQWILERTSDVEGWSSHDFIKDHLKKHGHHMRQPRRNLPRGLKVAPIDGSVGELWATLQDAEEPREVLDQLRDRRRFPWKTLAFDQQPRPPYSGTFTKKSLVVGPRTPFAQDPIFDYSYDSGDEWQDDDEGEDVDNFGGEKNLEEEEEEEDEEDEGEFDDWLDDTEDVEAAQPDLMDVDDAPMPEKLPKGIKKLKEQPIKRIVKLVPTWKGPVWENRIGEEGTEGLESYRIQLLNDTPVSLDPFTFRSTDAPQQFKTNYSTAIIGHNLNVRCLLSVEAIVQKEQPGSTIKLSSVAAAPTSAIVARAEAPRRVRSAFPSSHIPELYRLIEGDNRYLKDMITFLREKFDGVATKISIENELKESAVREGRSKESVWRVYREAWIAAGLEPAASAPSRPPAAPPTSAGLSLNPMSSTNQPTDPLSPLDQSLQTLPTRDGSATEPIVVDL
ncbi:hypothetical protein I305_04186 [Cryptococcus gattii E566]|uniref:Uncharacterized protein n=2 Tax=Cryptococcus gattii TaxID=37769 RepID=E6R2U0_CRYGW|nr:Hypothetical Protein CGB_C1400C [Cryptococcus gattii WM276]ADV20839.1 Hypothetical Protein CGB_C1400C [Cryptococcus gattii WM276]KIR82291.1 hypothetical protein I306_00616 [Cryptococcus gattii EJB2]KIY33320.1 hypothetical protein I305_04186 [Cryptococcus gattii E566]